MILDAHIHVGKWNFEKYRGMELTLNQAVEKMKKSGVDGALLITSDQKKNKQLLGEILADRSGLELYFAHWVSPDNGEELNFLEENLDSIYGIKIHPSFERTRVTDSRFIPYLKFCDDNSLTVQIHCGRWQEIASYKFALETAEKYPNANFILNHQGGADPQLKIHTAEEIKNRGIANAYLEISGTIESWTIEKGVRLIGAERYLFGSDYPLHGMAMFIAEIRELSISEKEKDMILGENLKKLLR